ncbi:MAG: hypothetical protein ACRCZF_13690 [Gemmataceae bacterium]
MNTLLIAICVMAPPMVAPSPVLILDDFRLVEGKVELFGEFYRATEKPGAKPELIPVQQVLKVVADRTAALEFMLARRDPESIVARVELASWFSSVSEPGRASAEIRAAIELAPKQPGLPELLKKYEKEQQVALAKSVPSAPKTAERAVPKIPPVLGDAAVQFGQKAQPVLMNLCAGCHADKKYEGTFKLERAPEGFANHEATLANLNAVREQLSAEEPGQSPLLQKALASHGKARQWAITNRNHPAYRTLEAWVAGAVPPPTRK